MYIYGSHLPINRCFPTKKYKRLKQILIRMKDRKFFVKECVICLDAITNESDCKMLSCFHIFHSKCIFTWLGTNSSCPMCNKVFNKQEDIKIDLDKHRMNAITVDNECFFSDHIIVRTPDLLT